MINRAIGGSVKFFVKINIFGLLSMSLIGCAFIPKVDHKQTYAQNCEMYTKELTLDSISLWGLDCGGSSGCVAVASLVPVTTFLVSGSIVLVGNTVHWLEYQGSCDEGLIQSSIDKIIPDTDTGNVDEAENSANEPQKLVPEQLMLNENTLENAERVEDTSEYK